MGLLLSDAGVTSLAESIDALATTMLVGDSAAFPDCSGGGDFTFVVLAADGAATEVVKVVDMVGDTWTIERGDNPQAWEFGAAIELRVNTELLTSLADSAGGGGGGNHPLGLSLF